ncbi:carboxypeptidase-like regulatory domain-containing protein, partial [Lutibacter holmesii]
MKKNSILIFLICVSFLTRGQEITSTPEENYVVKNISGNTKYQDYGVSYAGDSTVIFASSRKGKTIRNKVWKGNDQPFLQLYKGVYNQDGEITNIELFSKKINTKFHDADVTFTKDLKTIYFTRNNYLDKKFKKDTLDWNLNQLYKATVNEKGDWEVQQMPFNNDNYQTGHPALNKAEDKLYFISDMLGGYGKTDIYVVDILSDSTYSKPRNLGPNVNTKGKEMFPFIDGQDILYFSSDAYVDGMGGLDVYVTRIKNGVAVKKAENIGRPINSDKDDFGFVRQPNTNLGYFSSNRKGGKGDDDIYSFEEKQPLNFDCYQFVEGVVRDRESGALMPGALVELFDQSGEVIGSVISDMAGAFEYKVACDTPYKVVGSKQDYTTDSKEFITSNVHDLKLELGLLIEPSDFVTVRGMLMVNINPIYFDLDKSNIREDAAIEIE